MIEIIEHDTPKILAVIVDEYFDLLHAASKNIGIANLFVVSIPRNGIFHIVF